MTRAALALCQLVLVAVVFAAVWTTSDAWPLTWADWGALGLVMLPPLAFLLMLAWPAVVWVATAAEYLLFSTKGVQHERKRKQV